MSAPELPGLTFLQHLGNGGYADVHLYEQESPRMNVAVKILKADGLDAGAQAQFTAEADVMARLSDHPFIVPVMRTAVTEAGRPYIVMKYYPKPNLGVRARRRQFSVPDVLRIGIQISSAVETAHRAGILHRDIKPANILTSQYDDPGLTDFGIAAVTTSEGTTVAEGMSMLWAAPEVLFGISDGDVRSDVYALGATLWHLLAGRPPYELPGGDNSDLALMKRTQTDKVPVVPRDGVPETLQRFLRQALAKSPDGRQQSALALARGLQTIEQELRLPATPIVVPESLDTRATPLPDEDDEPATSVRGPRVVARQPAISVEDEPTRARAVLPTVMSPPLPPPAQRTASSGQIPRVRAASPAEPTPDATTPGRHARKLEAEPEVAQDVAKPEPRRSRRIAVVGALVAVVAVVTGAAIALSSGPGGSAQKGQQDTAADDGQQVVDSVAALAPGTPVVSARPLTAATARFVITYADAKAGDTLRWTRVGSGSPAGGSVRNGLIDLKRPACITVRAVRNSGLASAASPPVCAP